MDVSLDRDKYFLTRNNNSQSTSAIKIFDFFYNLYSDSWQRYAENVLEIQMPCSVADWSVSPDRVVCHASVESLVVSVEKLREAAAQDGWMN